MEIQYNHGDKIIFNEKNCAILGTNGTGKSTLIKKIYADNHSQYDIQLISAQRDLTFVQGKLKGKNDSDLADTSFKFNGKKNTGISKRHLSLFFEDENHNNLTQDDFGENIESILREHINTHSEASMNHKGGDYKKPKTKADDIIELWNSIFIDKKIKIDKGQIKVESGNDTYNIENLSDGERSALYLITKCFNASKKGIVIIDEGETHLNPALLYELWDRIEYIRSDCTFIYISHDLEFITSRSNCEKFWIKSFQHPNYWEIKKIDDSKIPEDLILQIIGTKKEKILLIESTETKEKKLYQKIYPGFKVIPVGSCENVITYTKALKEASESYNKEYYGLIDMDFKTKTQLSNYEKANIFSLPVVEYENLLVKEDIINFILKHQGIECDLKDFKNEIKELRSSQKFQESFYKHHITQEFNIRLGGQIGDDFEFKASDNIKKQWETIQDEDDYDKLLSLIKNKNGIKGKISFIGFPGKVRWEDYETIILNLFNTQDGEELRELFLNIMPEIKQVTVTSQKVQL